VVFPGTFRILFEPFGGHVWEPIFVVWVWLEMREALTT